MECELIGAFGRSETVNVVWYSKQVVCPICNGEKYVTFPMSNTESCTEKRIDEDPDSVDGLCDRCDGLGFIETVDYTLMTPDEISTYKSFLKDLEKREESLNSFQKAFVPYEEK